MRRGFWVWWWVGFCDLASIGLTRVGAPSHQAGVLTTPPFERRTFAYARMPKELSFCMKILFANLATEILLCALVFTTRIAHAGPMPPCIDATLSANGSILVVNDLTFDDPDESHVRHVTGSTFRVLRRYVDLNEYLRMNGPNTHFAGPMWSVVLTNGYREPMMGCPYTLVTDDGEYLVLVGGAAAFGDVLSIYRRRDHPGGSFGGPGPDHGVLVRRIPLSELWKPEQIPQMRTDHTPTWFASGTFAFSADNRTLIHKTRWGRTLQIDLETGKVSGM
jgi:hypothetical protein